MEPLTFDVSVLRKALNNQYQKLTGSPTNAAGMVGGIAGDKVQALRARATKFGGLPQVDLSKVSPKASKFTRIKGVK